MIPLSSQQENISRFSTVSIAVEMWKFVRVGTYNFTFERSSKERLK